jgi:predicted small lipoprotein YifL
MPSDNIAVFPGASDMRFILLSSAAAVLLAVSGCGIKGPLYLPPPPDQAAPAAPAQGAADHSKPDAPRAAT